MTDENRQDARGCFCKGMGPQASEMFFRSALPKDARDHFRNSRIEFLKAIRSLIDRRIDELSRSETKGTSVPVE